MSRTRLEQRGAAQGLRCLLAACASLLVAAPLLMAAPASAARVVEVRLGQHPGYSRLVFELDVPAGYKVERHAPTDGVQELVVSLDASADSQTLSRELDFIESVEIESITSRRSLVRIRLKGDNLRLKESMLANPPRIVLDVLSEAAIAKARAAEKASAKKELARVEAEKMAGAVALSASKPAASPAVEATAPKPGSVEKAATRREARLAQPPASSPGDPPSGAAASRQLALAAKKASPTPLPVPVAAKKAAPSPAQKPTQKSAHKPSLSPTSEPVLKLNRSVAPTLPPTTKPALNPAVRPAPIPAPTGRPKVAPAARPKVAPAAKARPTPPAAAATLPTEGGLFSMTNIAIGGGGLLLLAGAGFVFMRRRSAAGAIDPSVFENPLGEDNPFAELDSDVAAEQAEAGIDIPDATFEPENDDAAVPAQEGTDMDMATENTTIMDNVPDGIPAGGDDVSRMVAEFERRMKTMETRIDELVDAKERLERQVAAQTEELRVQRAAIARTQRAVRNMGRAGESAPTEPALRDPARPEGPRRE